MNKNVRLSSLKLRAVTNGDELLNDKKFRNLRNIEVIKSNVSQMIDVSGFSYLEKLNLAENGLKQVPPLPASIIALNMSFNPLQRWCLNRVYKKLFHRITLLRRLYNYHRHL